LKRRDPNLGPAGPDSPPGVWGTPRGAIARASQGRADAT